MKRVRVRVRVRVASFLSLPGFEKIGQSPYRGLGLGLGLLGF